MAVIADESNALCQLYNVDCCQHSHSKTNCSGEDDSITSEDLQERINSQLFITRETASGKVLWRCSIQNTDFLSDHVIAHDSLRYHFPSHSFRSMLLPLEGNSSPVQSTLWIRCYDSNEDKLAADDDEKWAFYHGLELISAEEPLGWIVHQLMDDVHGDHFTSFLFHTINVVRKHSSCWDEQLGLYSTPESTTSKMKFEENLKSHDQSFDESTTVSTFSISSESARAAINELFYGDFIKSSATVEDLHQKLQDMTSDDSNIDLFSLVEMIMKAYLAHMQKQFTLIRIMFETSCSGTLTDFYDEEVVVDNNHPKKYGDSLIGFRELHKILRTLWPNKISIRESTSIYYEAFDVMYPQSQWDRPCSSDGISFESFCIAADRTCLFSRMRRA
eukprot:scaffold28292_cov71-Cyclotella_meneghiniana.AAC.3